jgi:hypothetical protein
VTNLIIFILLKGKKIPQMSQNFLFFLKILKKKIPKLRKFGPKTKKKNMVMGHSNVINHEEATFK